MFVGELSLFIGKDHDRHYKVDSLIKLYRKQYDDLVIANYVMNEFI